jgi:hypothetical protein
MNQKFAEYIQPARSETRWWMVILTLVLWIIFYMVLSSSFVFAMDLFFDLGELRQGVFITPAAVYVLLLTFVIWILVFLTVVKLFHKRGINSLLGNSKRKFLYNFFVAIGISAVFLILSYNLAPADDQIIENLNFHKWLSVLPLGVCLMFFQVSAEELLFRGYLQQQLAVWIKNRWFYMVVPSGIFGFMHYDGGMGVDVGLIVVATTSLLGLFLADLTYRTGNLGAAIGVHFANNFSAMFWISYQEQISGLARYTAPAFFNEPAMFVEAAKSMLITASILFLIYFSIMEWRARR